MAEALKWEVAEMGGRCQALVARDGNVTFVITDEDGGSVPSVGEASRLGAYVTTDETWADEAFIFDAWPCVCKAKEEAERARGDAAKYAANEVKREEEAEARNVAANVAASDHVKSYGDDLKARGYTEEEVKIGMAQEACEVAAERVHWSEKVSAYRDADQKAVLDRLISCNGAILSWQLAGDEADRFAVEEANGLIAYDGDYDLYVHPFAVSLGNGGYTMTPLPVVKRVRDECSDRWTFFTDLMECEADSHCGELILTMFERADMLLSSMSKHDQCFEADIAEQIIASVGKQARVILHG